MKKKFILFSILLTILFAFAYFYVVLPALNIQTFSFLFSIVIILVVGLFIYGAFSSYKERTFDTKRFTSPIILLCATVVIVVGGCFIFSPIVSSKTYANRIEVTNGDFASDIEEVDLNNLPLLDKDSTQKVGDRVMGQLPELISQFYVSDIYTQISYNGRLVRVTPLEYNGIFKWFNNRNEGIPGYIMVDSTTGEAQLIKLNKGMKYMSSAYLNDNLHRHLRFQFPTALFGESNFEIDDDGNPYWVTPIYSLKWVEMLPDIKGVVLTDPCTGDSNYYDVKDVPVWVDHVYPTNLVISQIDDWGLYQDGWLNSFIGQKNVRTTTTGYTYLADETDIYIYTGITSAAADQSNIGFVLSNLRTKETKYYAVPGAEEYSAMASAEGEVQEKGYRSTFPLLINLNGNPTYLSSLKDASGLVKAYAFVDVRDYQKVKVTESEKGLKNAAKAYIHMLGSDAPIVGEAELTGVISNISNVVINGNTYYYLTIENNNNVYKAIITLDDTLPFKKVGDTISFIYGENNTITEIK